MSQPSTDPIMPRHVIGIDPGVNGGIAWSSPNGDKTAPMPATIGDFREVVFNILLEQSFFIGEARVTCYVEELPKFVRAIPSSAVFVMARNYGQLEGVLTAFQVPVVHVRPQTWQKALGLGDSKGGTKTQWKNKLKGRAQELFPEEHVTLKTADALLIYHAAQHRLI
jgi:hypothetical protein